MSSQEVFLTCNLFLATASMFIRALTIWSPRWIKICKWGSCKLDRSGCCKQKRIQRWRLEVFFGSCSAMVLPDLLISCASATQHGTSSSLCLLFPPPSAEITACNLFGTTTSHRGRKKKDDRTQVRREINILIRCLALINVDFTHKHFLKAGC